MIPLAVVLLSGAAWLAATGAAEPRLMRVLGHDSAVPRPEGMRRGVTTMAALLAGAACWLVVGGVVGAGIGLAIAVLAPRWVARLESRDERDRRDRLVRQAPLFADLLSATLASGATLRSALSAAADSVGDPTASAVRPVVAAIDLGADPSTAWRSVPGVDAHAAIVEALARSADTGASASDLLARIAVDLRRDHAVRVEVAARAAGVRAVAPLAACFLPAFLLLGVVPVVASLAQSVITG